MWVKYPCSKMSCSFPPPPLAVDAIDAVERSGVCSPGCNCVRLGRACGDAVKVADGDGERIATLERSVKSLSESLARAVDAELKALAYAQAVEQRAQKLYQQVKELEKNEAYEKDFVDNSLESVKTYNANNAEEYADFLEILKDYLGPDCWSIKVDEECLFDFYKEMGIKEYIELSILHDKIADCPHILFVNMFTKKKDSTIMIDMYSNLDLVAKVTYTAADETLTLDVRNPM